MTSKTVVVDAGLAIKWVLEKPGSLEASKLLDEWKNSGIGMLAPEVFAADVAEVLCRRCTSNELSIEEAKVALEALLESGPALVSKVAGHARVMEFASELGLSNIREAYYLALAEHENCQCWTADERLWRVAGDALPWLKWLGERGTSA